MASLKFFVSFLANVYFNDLVATAMTGRERVDSSPEGLPQLYLDTCRAGAAAWQGNVDKFFHLAATKYNELYKDAITGPHFEADLVKELLPRTYRNDVKQTDMRMFSKKALAIATTEAYKNISRVASDVIKYHMGGRKKPATAEKMAATISSFQVMVNKSLQDFRATIGAELTDKPGEAIVRVSKEQLEALKREMSQLVYENSVLRAANARLQEACSKRGLVAKDVLKGKKAAAPAVTFTAPEATSVEPDFDFDTVEADSWPSGGNVAGALSNVANGAGAMGLESFGIRSAGSAAAPAVAKAKIEAFDQTLKAVANEANDGFTSYDDMSAALDGF